MKRLLPRALILSAAILMGSACAIIQENPTAAHLAVTVATLKVIEGGDNQVERAQKVARFANEAKRLVDGETVTIGALEQAIKDRLDEENLAPSDRLLADALVITLSYELRTRVGEGLLDEQQRVTVTTVLDWVATAAGG